MEWCHLLPGKTSSVGEEGSPKSNQKCASPSPKRLPFTQIKIKGPNKLLIPQSFPKPSIPTPVSSCCSKLGCVLQNCLQKHERANRNTSHESEDDSQAVSKAKGYKQATPRIGRSEDLTLCALFLGLKLGCSKVILYACLGLRKDLVLFELWLPCRECGKSDWPIGQLANPPHFEQPVRVLLGMFFLSPTPRIAEGVVEAGPFRSKISEDP